MLRIGLIGCGAMGRDHVGRITNVLAGAAITGVYDVVPEATEKTIKDYGLDAKVYSSTDELITDPAIDAVMVCSRNDTHLDPILKCIETGKCVFTEKR